MKLSFIAAVFSVLLPLTAKADANIDLAEWNGANLEGTAANFDLVESFFNVAARRYARVRQTCNISHVALYVRGDNLRIHDFDVRFANGRTQDVDIRNHFRKNSFTNWKDLRGELRCIDAFAITATPDFDFDNAAVELWGVQHTPWGPQRVFIGRVKVRDF